MMKRVIVVLILLLCLYSSPVFSDVLVYEKNVDDEKRIVECRIEPAGNGYVLEISEVTVSEGDTKGNTQKTKCELDSNFSILTLEYSNSDPEEESEVSALSAKRNGNIIEIKGFSEKGEINKKHKLGSLPWYEPTFGLQAFAASDNKSVEYWALIVYWGRPVKFSASKKGTEILEINGKQVEAVHVIVKLKLLGLHLFPLDYWFRKPDGRLLRYKIPERGNEPPVTLELVSEG